MVRGKVRYEQCFEAANQETPLTNPSVTTPAMARELGCAIAKAALPSEQDPKAEVRYAYGCGS